MTMKSTKESITMFSLFVTLNSSLTPYYKIWIFRHVSIEIQEFQRVRYFK